MLDQIKRLRPLFGRRDALLYVALFLLMVGGAVADIIGVGVVPVFVMTLAEPDKVMSYPVAQSILETLGISAGRELVILGCAVLLVVFVLKNAYLIFVNYAQVRITEYHRVRMSDRLFSAYMRAPYEFHLSRNSAELLRNVQVETNEIFVGVINPILNVWMGAMMTIGIMVLLIATTPWVAFAGFAIIGLGSWGFLRAFKERVTRYGIEAKNERKESIKAVNQGIGAFVDARVLGREQFFINAFHRSIAHFARVDRLRQVIKGATTPLLETISVAGLLLIVVALLLIGGDTTSLIPILALFGAAIVRLRSTIGVMVHGANQIQYSIAAVPNVMDDLTRLEVKGSYAPNDRRTLDSHRLPFRRCLVLDNVTYSYPDTTKPALDRVSVQIEAGSSVAFVGSTGSGKTTLINVILGLLQPQQGSIEADGVDIFSNLKGWHANIGYIPQAIYLLDDTIRSNIAYGIADENIDEDQLWMAIRAAQLEDFVRSLDKDVQTVAGEQGVRLSGGQRQRIGLARALYHDPEVLVMDEATSALDNETEGLVMQALRELQQNRTVIMIAHRLSTVRQCDRLYYLEDGRVAASGSYDELSRANARFRRMAEVA